MNILEDDKNGKHGENGDNDNHGELTETHNTTINTY